MSMSEFIAKITGQFKSLPPEKRRLMVICCVGALLIALMLRTEFAEPVTAGTVPHKAVKVGTISAQPAQKEILPVPAAARDPFAVPSGFEAKSEMPPKSLQPINPTTSVPAASNVSIVKPGKDNIKEEMPILIGTINNNATGIAIISYKGCSHSYYTGQLIGSYKLISINAKSVVIEGLQGQQVLTLGR